MASDKLPQSVRNEQFGKAKKIKYYSSARKRGELTYLVRKHKKRKGQQGMSKNPKSANDILSISLTPKDLAELKLFLFRKQKFCSLTFFVFVYRQFSGNPT